MRKYSAHGDTLRERRRSAGRFRSLGREVLEDRRLLAFEPLTPPSSLVMHEKFEGSIASSASVVTHALQLDGSQSLSVRLATTGGLSADLRILAPNNSTVISQVGNLFQLESVPIAAAGNYTLEVRSSGGTVGSFQIDSYLNAEFEGEGFGGGSNNTLSSAELISSSSVSLGNGGSRLAIVGGMGGSDPVDWYRFRISDGEVVSLSLGEANTTSLARVELFDSSNRLLATGTASEELTQAIVGFRDATTNGIVDDYFVRIVSAQSPYHVSIHRQHELELGSGNAFSTAQPIQLTGTVLGSIDNGFGGSLNPLGSFNSIGDTGFVPPDAHIAVGPQQIVAVVNTQLAIYNKATNAQVFIQNLSLGSGFFGGVGATSFVFDPWVIYDNDSGRFFVVAIDAISSTSTSNMFIAVSKTSTPTTGSDWHKYKIDFSHNPNGTGLGTGVHFPDYPKASVGPDALYISGNYFTLTSGTGSYAGISAIRKSDLLTGAPHHFLYQEYFSGISVFPMQQIGGGSTQYFSESIDNNKIRIHAITAVTTNPTRHTFDLNVSPYETPLKVPQPLGAVPLDALDARVMTGVSRNGSAWFAHSIKDPAITESKTVVRWYEVKTNNFPVQPPTVVQSGNVNPGLGLHTWMPAIAVNGAGSMAIGFSLAGASQFASASYTGRLATDPLGTVVLPIQTYAEGTALNERIDGQDRNRWGDYSGLAVDPSDDATFYAYNEYARLLDGWGTRIGKFQLDEIPESDWYQFQVNSGQSFTVTTSTPFSDVGNPINTLDPDLALVDPTGTVIATDQNSVGDGRNATITHTAALTGSYRVRTYGAGATRGNYRLRVSPLTIADPPLDVVDTDPDPGQHLNQFPASISVRLSQAVFAPSVQASDLKINGVAATSVTLLDGKTLVFVINPANDTGDGTYTFTMDAGSLVDLQGAALASPVNRSFVVDRKGPRITSTLWNGAALPSNRILPTGSLRFDAFLDEDLLVSASARRGPYAPGIDDVKLVDRDTLALFRPTSIDYDTVSKHFIANFSNLPDGRYDFTLTSGPSAFEDTIGNRLDGEPNLSTVDGTITGDGVSGGNYTLGITLDANVTPAQPFEHVNRGSLVDRSQNNRGLLLNSQDQDRIRFYGQAGQKVAATITWDPAVVGTAELVGLLPPVQNASGNTISIPPTLIPASGFIELRLAANGTTRYNAEIIFNAAIEQGDASNSVPASITASRIETGTGQWSVVGSILESGDVDLYRLDLTGSRGTFLEIGAQSHTGSIDRVELLSPTGTVLATSTVGKTYDQHILQFPMPSLSGGSQFMLRVTGETPGNYVLVVQDGQVFENEGASALRTLGGGGRAVGHLAADQSVIIEPDDYAVGTKLNTAVPGVTIVAGETENVYAANVDADIFIPPTGSRTFSSDFHGPLGFRFGGEELRLKFAEPIAAATVLRGSKSATTAGLLALDQFDEIIGISSSPAIPPNTQATLSISRPVRDIYQIVVAGLSPVPVDRITFSRIATDTSDRYLISATAGETITISTKTPFDDVNGSPHNSLDPSLIIYQPDGVSVITQDLNSATDGKNAVASFSAPTTGLYVVEVRASSGVGEYRLELDRQVPQAVDDVVELDEGATVSLLSSGNPSVLFNDIGLADTPITLSLVTPPQHAGQFQFRPDGTFTYTHNGSENHTDSFVYRVTDYNGQSDTAVVSFTIRPVSDSSPTPVPDQLQVPEGGTATLLLSGAASVLANDTGLIDAPIIVSLETAPTRATNFTLNANGTFSYQHNGSEVFTDSFSYRATDNDGDFSIGTVSITMTPVSDATPVAVADSIRLAEGGIATSLIGGGNNVTANDTGLVDGPIVVSVVTPPTRGALTLNANGTFSYQHNGSENFLDSFVYRITDNDGQIATATVAITIDPVSDATPQAVNDQITLAEGGLATQLASGAASVLANDNGLLDSPVQVQLVTPPNRATSFSLNPDGTFSYRHNGSETFTDQFTYRITDNDGQTSNGVVQITITPVSDATPVVLDGLLTVLEGGTATTLASGATAVLQGATGLTDSPIVLSVDSAPAHATSFVLRPDGTFQYVHNGSEHFQDSFTFRATDNDGGFDTGTITITIQPVSDATPSAQLDQVRVPEGGTAQLLVSGQSSVLANDLQLLDTPVVVELVTGPIRASSFNLQPNGTFSYTHNGSETFVDLWTYRLRDNDGQTSVGTVEIIIDPVSDATPDAINDELMVLEGGTATSLASNALSVLANDVDLLDEPIQVQVVTGPQFATNFQLFSDGRFTYTHNGSNSFNDSFVYRIIDSDGQSDTATVTIQVQPVSDATPNAVDDSLNVNENGVATQLSSGGTSLLANDLGLLDTPLSLTIETLPRFGSVVLQNNGTFTYTHNGSENFLDSFVYRIVDSDGQFDTALVTIHVSPVSDSTPNAIDDTAVGTRGGTITTLSGGIASVLQNDQGLIDRPVVVSLVTPPVKATQFTLNADGTFVYVHDGLPGSPFDQFVYRITDNDGQTDMATVALSFPPNDQGPNPVSDTIRVLEGGTASVLLGGATSVLANDAELGNTPIVVTLETQPRFASNFTLNPDGTFSYTHDGSESFLDSFVYRVTDVDEDFGIGTVTIVVEPVSDATPSLVDDAINVAEGGTANLLVGGANSVLSNDLGQLDTPAVVTIVTPPLFASSFSLATDGKIAYVHDGSENFLDSFVYRVTDNDGQTDTATVTITIQPVSDATPQAVHDSILVVESGTTSELTDGAVSVLANDLGLADTPIDVVLVTPPAFAVDFEFHADGTFVYVHNGSEEFDDSFVYRITDNDGQVSSATVQITVQPETDTTPIANNDQMSVAEGGTTTLLANGNDSVLDNDSGLADVPITISIVDPPKRAAHFALHGDGTLTYTHDGSENFVDSFTYRISDNDGESEIAIVNIAVDRVSDQTPQAIDDHYELFEGATLSTAANSTSSLRANDLGLADGPIALEIVSPPTQGTLLLQADGSWTYTHNGSENFVDQASYRIQDNDGETSTATIFFTIKPVSDATPVANSDSISVAEGGLVTALSNGQLSVLANDVGLIDQPLVVTLLTPPSFASSFQFLANGTFQYRHNGSEEHGDSFQYQIVDNDGQISVGTVSIAVTPVSDATPVAVPDTLVVREGQSLLDPDQQPFQLLANDLGLTDSPVVVSIVTPPAHAVSYGLTPTGFLSYEHDGSENFTDRITYRITDNDGQTSEAIVQITVIPVSDATPQPVDDTISLNEGGTATSLVGGSITVLANDVGLEDSPISLAVVTPPSFATSFQLNPNGSFTYTHDGSERFTDQFTYRLTDNDGQSATATVRIQIAPVSDSTPDAVNNRIVVAEGGTTTVLSSGNISVLVNDAGLLDAPILAAIATPPIRGTLTFNPDGTFRYVHDGSEFPTDSFVYRITDNDGQSDTATVTIDVTPVSDATPIAVADTIQVAEGGTIARLQGGAASVLTNDTGLVDTPTVVSIVTPPAFAASFELRPDGTFTYTHNGSENFSDQFTYRITDNDGQTSQATAAILISKVSDATPIAISDAVTLLEGGTSPIDAPGVLVNDQGLLDSPIAISIVRAPLHASAFAIQADGKYTYIHNGSENHTDSVRYRITDNDGQSAETELVISITQVSDSSPDAVADSIVVAEGGVASVTAAGTSLLANDSGLLDTPISIQIITQPQHGTLSLNSGGTFVYTHNGSENHTDRFEYRLTDNDGQTDTALAQITVTPVSDATPVAVADTLRVSEGGRATNLIGGATSVLNNDQGLIDGPVQITVVTPPRFGILQLNADGTLSYQHDGSERFADFFNYQLRDNDGEVSTSVVTITITPVSDATPSAFADAIQVGEGQVSSTLVGGQGSLLANDIGLNDTPLVLDIVTRPQFADLFELRSDGTFLYEHDGTENFADTITYRLTDSDGQTTSAIVSVSIQPISDATPEPVEDQITLNEGGTTTVLVGGEINVLANDLGLLDTPVRLELVDRPNQAASFSLSPSGTFSYQHNGREEFEDRFTYRVTDNDGESRIGTVRIAVQPVSDSTPVALPDSLSVGQGKTQTLLATGQASVLANDSGFLDGPIQFELSMPPVHASNFVLNADGTFSYEHDGGNDLFDAFEYTLTDNDGEIAAGRVEVTIRPTNPIDLDLIAPTATLSVENITAPSTLPHGFLVRYQDNDGFSPAVLDNQDITIITPSGATRIGVFRGIRLNSQRNDLFANYQVPVPEGGWQARDNGRYQILLNSNQVMDLSNNAIPSRILGTFNVAIPGLPRVANVTINDGRQRFDTFDSVAVRFTQNVTVQPSALVVIHERTNQVVRSTTDSMTYDAATRTARWNISNLPLSLPGRYRIQLRGTDIRDAQGNSLDGGDYIHGEIITLTWPGDADLDLDVDFADFLIHSNSFTATPAKWTDGNFDDEASVAFTDFLLLAANFGQPFPNPAPPTHELSPISGLDPVASSQLGQEIDPSESRPLGNVKDIDAIWSNYA